MFKSSEFVLLKGGFASMVSLNTDIYHSNSPMSTDDMFPWPRLGSIRGHEFKITHSRPQLEARRYICMRHVDL